MNAAYYHSPELPWSPSLVEERRFRRISLTTLALTLLFSIVVSQVELPPLDRSETESLPPRLAKLVIQEKPQPPAPLPSPVPPSEKMPETPKPEVPKEALPQQPPQQQQIQAARAKAASSGLLAMQNELASLQKNSLSALTGGKALIQSNEQDGTTRRSMITSGATSGSGGISTSQLGRDTGQVRLAGRDTTTVQSALLQEQEAQGGGAGNRKTGRSIEQIKLVLDQNKGALFTLYQRALRTDPSLQGKMVLEITIAPSGEITQCKVVSSELKDEDLIRKVVARVKLFQFGAKAVDPTVFTWPIDFLPSM